MRYLMAKQPIPLDVFIGSSQSEFEGICRAGKPSILKQCDFGFCFERWTPEYLAKKIGDKPVKIHISQEEKLNFIQKNFTYKLIPFNEFIKDLVSPETEHTQKQFLYLRSTSDDNRSRQATKIEQSFPSISDDLRPPDFIPYYTNISCGSTNYHSSVLRIASANVQIWTHFDLYDNVLCQVVGRKRVILFHPNDIKYLYVVGDKSLIEDLDDVDLKKYPKYAKATPYSCILEPGQTLYIPALWWHNIKTIDDQLSSQNLCSIGFNIFWRDTEVDEKLFDPMDVYGNKNMIPMNTASVHIDKAVTALNKMPTKYKQFYTLMLSQKLKAKCLYNC